MKKVGGWVSSFLVLLLVGSCSTLRPRTGLLYVYMIWSNSSFVQDITLRITAFSARNSSGEEMQMLGGASSVSPVTSFPINTSGGVEAGDYSNVKTTIHEGHITVGGVVYPLQIPNPRVDIPGTFRVVAEQNNYMDINFSIDDSKSVSILK